MTIDEKARITELRKNGVGYATIANSLGLTKDTVKSFCRRNGLNGYAGNSKDHKNCCKECGVPIIQVPGTKKKIFCGYKCRKIWWAKHPEQINRITAIKLTCAGCGKEFLSYKRDNRKYCSHSCYISDRFGGGNRE